jgi:D-alanyl-D-alanine carboxypeptidase/D-alanyl-D-alanine-endopeptidase (penicillin-binding protein 4)
MNISCWNTLHIHRVFAAARQASHRLALQAVTMFVFMLGVAHILPSVLYAQTPSQTPPAAQQLGSQQLGSVPNTALSAVQAALQAGYGTGYLTTDTTLPKPVRDLRADINQMLGDSAASSALVGVYMVSVKSKDVLYARNEYKSLVPASNMKLFTTAAALEYLGEDFQYTTSIFLDGLVRSNGEYVGNVIIRGAGDPSMSTFFFTDPMTIIRGWCKALDSLGIKAVLGNIISDDSYFDDAPLGVGWSWDDIPYPFSAPISALSFNDNKVDVTISSGNIVGAPAPVAVVPPTSYVTIDSKFMTVRPDSSRSIFYDRAMRSNVIELDGAIPFDTTEARGKRTVSVTVDNPSLFLAHLFRQSLQTSGIAVYGNISTWSSASSGGAMGVAAGKKISYAELRPVCHHSSPPLKEILRVVNGQSHNLCAEALLRTLGKEVYGKGSAENGVKAVRELCQQRGIPLEGSSFVDGSGLSRMNMVSARTLGTLAATMYNSKYRSAFLRSLASPLEKSTLQGRMKNSLAATTLRAKTGTLGGVSALTGYVTTRDQEPIAFSIIFNNFAVPQSEVRSIQDGICMRLASFARK